MTPPSGHSMGGHPISGPATHSKRVIVARKHRSDLCRPVSFPLNAPSSIPKSPLQLYQSPSNLPHRGSNEITSSTKGSPQHAPHQRMQSQAKKQPPPAINATSSGDIQPGNDEKYSNELQRGLEDDIHKQAAAVIREVSGDRHQIKTDIQPPYDPNLMCPMCMKRFRIGEIQKFKRHVNTCDGNNDA